MGEPLPCFGVGAPNVGGVGRPVLAIGGGPGGRRVLHRQAACNDDPYEHQNLQDMGDQHTLKNKPPGDNQRDECHDRDENAQHKAGERVIGICWLGKPSHFMISFETVNDRSVRAEVVTFCVP